MRLDHLLSKEDAEASSRVCLAVEFSIFVISRKCDKYRDSSGFREENRKHLVAMRPWETPVPIPNTMVKTWPADGTALETVWESRWLPDYKKRKQELQPVMEVFRKN